MTTLTIALCTRDRAEELRRALRTIAASCAEVSATERSGIELLVVDDGPLPPGALAAEEAAFAALGIPFRHHDKSATPGLLRSRIVSTRLAHGAVVLFCDDDIAMEPGYLPRFLARWREHPEAAGIGGVDSLGPRVRWRRLLAEILTGVAAVRTGRLSLSGYNGESVRWPHRRAPFRVEYLFGFNMSFRREALAGLAEQPWLTGYGLGEDIYLSLIAGRHGPLLVDPGLRVAHHQAPSRFGGRDDVRRYFMRKVVNHAHLLQVAGAGALRCAALRGTALCFLIHHGLAYLVTRLRGSERVAFTGARLEGTWDGWKGLSTRLPGPGSSVTASA